MAENPADRDEFAHLSDDEFADEVFLRVGMALVESAKNHPVKSPTAERMLEIARQAADEVTR